MTQKSDWKKELEEKIEKLCIEEGQEPKMMDAFTYKVYKETKSFFSKVLKEEFQRGRQSVLDEWKEEQKKLLQGFSYKKKK